MASAGILFALVGPAALAGTIVLDPPPGGQLVLSHSESPASYRLPTGPFRNGAVPTTTVEGAVETAVWQVASFGGKTLDLVTPLRTQLVEAGFDLLLDCDAPECGGFDFRYALDIEPEPEMHVDLGDFHFLAARRGNEVASVIVSRSSETGFVQVTQVGDVRDPAETDPAPSRPGEVPSLNRAPSGLGDRLLTGGAIVLQGLDFASGASRLPERDFPMLDDLAAWLKTNPTLRVAVVGHTDASGGLPANIALSRQRAESVRDYLLTRHGIPAAQVEAHGVGYLAPIASNLTAEGREKNRRVEVMLTSTASVP